MLDLRSCCCCFFFFNEEVEYYLKNKKIERRAASEVFFLEIIYEGLMIFAREEEKNGRSYYYFFTRYQEEVENSCFQRSLQFAFSLIYNCVMLNRQNKKIIIITTGRFQVNSQIFKKSSFDKKARILIHALSSLHTCFEEKKSRNLT